MSFLEQFANRPWASPPQYRDTPQPSQGDGGRGVERRTEIDEQTGEVSVVDGRDHYAPTAFGDGRPSGGSRDNEPMVYRGPNPGAEFGVADDDEPDEGPAEYVPKPKIEPPDPVRDVAYEKPDESPRRAVLNAGMSIPIPAKQVGMAEQAIAKQVDERLKVAVASQTSLEHRLGFSLHGVRGHEALIGVRSPVSLASAEELEACAAEFLAWAKMLRAMGR